MAEQEGFAARWSRRKTEERMRRAETAEAVPPPAEEAAVRATMTDAAGTPPASIEEDTRPDSEILAEHGLPDIESLTEESDFTGFMKEGVPERLRNLALRKLWRSNPVFANLDGMNDYDEDYSEPIALVGDILNYRPGRGYIDEGDEGEPAEATIADAEEPGEEVAGDPVSQGDMPAGEDVSPVDVATVPEAGSASTEEDPDDGSTRDV